MYLKIILQHKILFVILVPIQQLIPIESSGYLDMVSKRQQLNKLFHNFILAFGYPICFKGKGLISTNNV